MATKKQMLSEITAKLNPTELETLGINEDSTLQQIKDCYASLPKEINPTFNKDLTEAAANGNTEEKIDPEEKTNTEEKIDPEVKNDFDELLGKISGSESPQPKEKIEKPLITKERKKRKKGESNPDSFRIEGYILLLATDTVFPTILSIINNMIDKKHPKINVSDLQLSQKDFDKLEPLADQAADYMSVNLNPIAGYLLVSSFMYANNMIAIKMNMNNDK